MTTSLLVKAQQQTSSICKIEEMNEKTNHKWQGGHGSWELF
jgi:hypothetical protein